MSFFTYKDLDNKTYPRIGRIAIFVLILVGMILTGFNSWTTVPAGRVKVATMFGKVSGTYSEGFHVINPLYDFTEFDVREKVVDFKEMGVPSADQLITQFDISVQYRIIRAMAGEILMETGTPANAVNVHLIPKFRSLLREVSKGVDKAEMFYQKDIQQRIQSELETGLKTYCSTKGIDVQHVLIRNVELPSVIRVAVEEKKKRQQEAEKQQAELERFEIEQQQKVKTAQAEYEAAKLQAASKIAKAEGEAKSNLLVAKSITNQLIDYQKIQRWNGVLPTVTGSGGTLINLK